MSVAEDDLGLVAIAAGITGAVFLVGARFRNALFVRQVVGERPGRLIRKQRFLDEWAEENQRRESRGGTGGAGRGLRTFSRGQIESMWRFGKRQHRIGVANERKRTKDEIIVDIRRAQRALGIKQTGKGTLRNRKKQSLAGTLGNLHRQAKAAGIVVA